MLKNKNKNGGKINKLIIMSLKKNPRLFALLLTGILTLSLYSSSNFNEKFVAPKNYYFFFLMLPLVAFIFIAGIRTKLKFCYKINLLDASVIAYYLYNLFRLLFTENIDLYNIFFIRDSLLVILYLLLKDVVSGYSNDEFKKYFNCLIIGFIILLSINALYGIIQYFSATPHKSKDLIIGGSFGNPGPYTNFIVLLLPFILPIIFKQNSQQKRIRIFSIIAFLLILIALPISKARTSWICFIVSLFVYSIIYFYQFERIQRFLKSIIVKMIFITIILFFTVSSAFYLYHYKKGSSLGRLFIWEITAEMIKDKPVFGQGYNSYEVQHNNYQANYFKTHPEATEKAFYADKASYACNEYLQITSDLGIVGLILFLAITLIALLRIYDKNKVSPEKRIFIIASKVSLITFLVCSLFSYPLRSLPSYILFYIPLAYISSSCEGKSIEIYFSKGFVRIFSFLAIFIFFMFYIDQINKFNAEKTWQKVFIQRKRVNSNEAFEAYQSLYTTLSSNKYFLYNYGAELVAAKKYKEGIEILNEDLDRLNDVDIYTYLGHAYDETQQYKKAEESFTHASNIVPSKFFPKYNLVKLYIKTGREKKADSLAKKILQMRIKVESDMVNSIRKEMSEFLIYRDSINSNNQNH
jgi:O-antigen polymerase